MNNKSYGVLQQNRVNNDIEFHVEEINLKGFTIVDNLFSSEELDGWRGKIDFIYKKQEGDFGKQSLKDIQELDLCRAPLLYDVEFIDLAMHPRILSIVRKILGEWYILNLQNAIINRPGTTHHQSSWHRDLPHQNFITSQPLAINALFAIDEFSSETGGTHVVPFTHQVEQLPSDSYIDNNSIITNMPAGSAVVFDTMLFHRAGKNTSKIVRRAVNHLYTKPIIKQQYDFPRALGKKYTTDPDILRLLGYTSQVAVDDKSWRLIRTINKRT